MTTTIRSSGREILARAPGRAPAAPAALCAPSRTTSGSAADDLEAPGHGDGGEAPRRRRRRRGARRRTPRPRRARPPRCRPGARRAAGGRARRSTPAGRPQVEDPSTDGEPVRLAAEVAPRRQSARADRSRLGLEDRHDLRVVLADDDRCARLDDARLLGGDVRPGRSEDLDVVELDVGHHGDSPSATLVASKRPPRPTSITAASTATSAK